jgi:SH3-like domain-containing protein
VQPDIQASAVYERPLLVAGSTVTTIAQHEDWWQVKTPEGVTGWLRVPAGDQSVVRADESAPAHRFADGAQVVVRTPEGHGIPLRAQPISTAPKVVALLPDGSGMTVLSELGDWLHLRTSDGIEGWGRWQYDGAQYLYAR